MYYGLLALWGYAVVLGQFGPVPFPAWAVLLSGLWLLTVCRLANIGLARLFQADTNFESPAITALILSFILAPATTGSGFVVLGLAGVVAMASKYLLAVRARHIFNPAALALVTLGLLGSDRILWWVATPALLPAVAVMGFLVARKLQRTAFVALALAAALATMHLTAWLLGVPTSGLVTQAFTSWPLVFFATIMLTEPATMPATARWRWVYAVVVGGLFACQLHIGPIAMTPELALILGNILSFVVSWPSRFALKLSSHRRLTPGIQEFQFQSNRPIHFRAGQYLEWTLPHLHPDSRGSRRYFTVASSPTESEVRLALRVGPGRVSSFKTALQSLRPGARLSAMGPAGDFVLPPDSDQKLVWLAGGIGITPFRSQARYLLDRGEQRDIVLLYFAASPEDFAYRDDLEQAAKIGLTTHCILFPADPAATWTGLRGPLTPELLERLAPHYQDRAFYLSGPAGFIRAQRRLLASLHIPRRRIRTDDFPGY
jgi:ferredoxin-NADP reductase